MGLTIAFAIFAMTVFVLIDVILIDEIRINTLGRAQWILIVIFVPLFGSIFWLTMGRNYSRTIPATSGGMPETGVESLPVEISGTEARLAEIDAEIELTQQRAKIRELEEKLRNRKQLP